MSESREWTLDRIERDIESENDNSYSYQLADEETQEINNEMIQGQEQEQEQEEQEQEKQEQEQEQQEGDEFIGYSEEADRSSDTWLLAPQHPVEKPLVSPINEIEQWRNRFLGMFMVRDSEQFLPAYLEDKEEGVDWVHENDLPKLSDVHCRSHHPFDRCPVNYELNAKNQIVWIRYA